MNQLKIRLVKLSFFSYPVNNLMPKSKLQLIWYSKEKKVISCDETNKVLNENYDEIKILLQNAFDDAVLIGCDEKDFKKKNK